MRRTGAPAFGGTRVVVAAVAVLILAALALGASEVAALAQAKHPFAVGARETGGSSEGIVGWILAKQTEFHRQLAAGVRAARESAAAAWALAGLAFAYGVFHAAGPGHGKAVIASYMTANERALRRGAAIAFGAAALQGLVAFALVAIGAALLGASATQMTDAAQWIETASYGAIFALGLWLSLRKAHALRAAWSGQAAPVCADCGQPGALARGLAYTPSAGASALARAVPMGAGPACAHPHMADPALLGESFRWRETAATLIAAGARPCSGAIVVLVFALAQGAFWAGGLAVAAMSLGTALTTTGLAAFAVLFKRAAMALSRGRGGEGGAMIGLRALELAAALALALLGAGLLTGALTNPGGA